MRAARSPASSLAGAAAQDQQIYRYVDPNGRIIYSDHAPPPDAKNVEAKKLESESDRDRQVSLAAQRAQERYPLTLYTFPCGDVCDRAEALLNRRGVPLHDGERAGQSGAEKLQKLTGELQAPVLQAGDKLIAKGFNEAQWQMLLDNAGYPAAPSTRRAASGRGSTERCGRTSAGSPRRRTCRGRIPEELTCISGAASDHV